MEHIEGDSYAYHTVGESQYPYTTLSLAAIKDTSGIDWPKELNQTISTALDILERNGAATIYWRERPSISENEERYSIYARLAAVDKNGTIVKVPEYITKEEGMPSKLI